MSLTNVFVDVERGIVSDRNGNVAYVDHFYGMANFNEPLALEMAVASIESLIDCKSCINCTDLIGFENIVENRI